MKLRIGLWNMERDRDRQTAARQAFDYLEDHQLDALLVEESADYVKALRHEAKRRNRKISRPATGRGTTSSWSRQEIFRVVAKRGRGRGETAVIVAPGVHAHRARWLRLTWRGWWTVRGHLTPPKFGAAVVIAHQLRVVALHEAPSVRWRRRRMLGPKLRQLSVRVFGRRLVRWARGATDRPLLLGGDWNATPGDRGPFTPHWIARSIGGQLVEPDRGTRGRRKIDFAIVRGVQHAEATVHDATGDHDLVIVTVST